MQQKIKDIRYIGVPFCSGTNREGTQYAPHYFIQGMQLSDSMYSIVNSSQSSIPVGDDCKALVHNYRDVLLMKEALKLEMADVLETYKNVIVLGGDHSISMGSISGLLEKKTNIGVIWIDAHTDINTETTSPSGNAHGMPLASLMGICNSEINNNDKKLNPKNVFWIGARDIDDGEWENIKKLGIEKNVFTCSMVHQFGMRKIIQNIHKLLIENTIEQLHVSFDIDVMDPSIVTATGTPVLDGLTEQECDILISELFDNKMPHIVSIDFVEYNPLMDNANHQTGLWCLKILKKIQDLLY